MIEPRGLRLAAKRGAELWIYSFADLSLILMVFFIAITAIFAVKAKNNEIRANRVMAPDVPTAGRGQQVAQSLLSVEFDVGSAELKPMAMEELNTLLPMFKALKTGFVDLEGYADSRPLGSHKEFTSNLDLSNRRAVRVAEWFMAQGVSPLRLRTYSYGNGRTWQGKNDLVKTDRRVLIKLYAVGDS